MEATKIVINYHEDGLGFNQISFIKDGVFLTIELFEMKEHARYLNLDITEFQKIGVAGEVVEMIKIIKGDEQFDANSDNYVGFINIDPTDWLSSQYGDAMMELVNHPERYEEDLKKVNLYFESKPQTEELILIERFD